MPMTNLKTAPHEDDRKVARQKINAAKLRTSRHLQPQPLIFSQDVERSLNLGGGYIVLKLRDGRTSGAGPEGKSKVSATLLDTSFPPIALDTIQDLFSRQNDSKTNPKHATPAPIKNNRANEAFMAQLDRQGMAFRQRCINEGLLLASADFIAPLAISRQALSKAVKEHRMFYVDGPSNAQLYPAFFITHTQQRRQLEKVSKQLGDLPGASKWQFFITPKASLAGRTPVDALKDGEFERVLTAATAFRER